MRKRLFSLILLTKIIVLSTTASNNNFLLWQKAQKATESGNYEEAYQTYKELNRQCDSIYQEVYGEEVEDLRTTYQIDELELQNKQSANHLLSYLIGTISSLSVLILICLFFFRRQYWQKNP